MKAVRLSIFFLLINIALQVNAKPAHFSFLKYQIDNGLSHNTTWCTLQDSYGFIWIGTNQGLNRFDGKHYKIFNILSENTTPLAGNQIFSLAEDQYKTLWIGTASGLFRLNLQFEILTPFNLQTEDGVIISSEVKCIIADDSGRIWIGTSGQGLFIYDPDKDILIQNSLYSGFISALYKSPVGNIYMNSHEGNILEFNKSGYLINTYQSPELNNNFRNLNIFSIYYKDGMLWYGYDVFGLVRVDLRTREIEIYRDNNHLSTYIKSIHPYSDRELMIGTENGLFIFDTQKKYF